MKEIIVVHSRMHGFTLVETLVAIAVLLIVIIGPISAAQKGIQQAFYANEQLTAVFLAQETVEAIRQRRDDRALQAWNNPSGNIDTSIWSDAGCDNNPGPFQCVFVSDDGISYERFISIDLTAEHAYVNVRIQWTNRSLFGGAARSIVLQTYLYDQYSRFGQ